MATHKKVAYQGSPGAYSHSACASVFPHADAVSCLTFEDVFEAVRAGKTDYGMIPIDNSIAGRVADIHHLLPNSGITIIGEHFEPIDHCLLGLPGSSLGKLTEVHSHVHALNQCRTFLRAHRLKAIPAHDTAGAADILSHSEHIHSGVIASATAAKIYGLKILKKNIQDRGDNTTRFLIIAKKPVRVNSAGSVITSFIFRVKSVPAALFKAIAGFATNGVNIIKIESYIVDGTFTVAQFYVEIEGHPDETRVKRAFEELHFFSEHITILGTYPAHPFRGKVPKQSTSK